VLMRASWLYNVLVMFLLHVDNTKARCLPPSTQEMIEKSYTDMHRLASSSSEVRVQHNALFLLSERLTDLVSCLPITHDDVLVLLLVDEPGPRSLDGYDDAE
jgi:hypothetical protein